MQDVEIFSDYEKSILHGFASLRSPLVLEKVVIEAAFPLAARDIILYKAVSIAFRDLCHGGFIRELTGGNYPPLFSLTKAGEFVCRKLAKQILEDKAMARMEE